MTVLRAVNGFDGMSDPKLSQNGSFVLKQMTGNSNFTTPDPSLASLQAAINEFDDAVSAALTRDSDAVNTKNEKREALINILHLLIYYVLYTSKGNRAIAETSGFKFAKDPAPAPPITKPTNLRVVNSDQTGAMDVSTDPVKGGMAYMHQRTTDPALTNWITHTCTKSKCTIEGLTPGTLYFWRVGVVGTKDQILYSDVVSRVAS